MRESRDSETDQMLSSESARAKLSICVPVYYNAESLPVLEEKLAWLEGELNACHVDLELIFVNDGSGDDSLAALLRMKAARPATKVVSLSRNFGSVAASKTAFRFVTGDVFTILSADLQDPVEQVLRMVEEWRRGHKLVISVRAARQDPLGTRVFASLYYRIIDLMVVRGYPRGGFDMMLMDKAMLPYLAGSTKGTNPALYSYWLGFPPKILPYTRLQRVHGKSRFTLEKKLVFFINSLTGFSVRPIRLLSLVGVVTALLSFLYGAYVAAFAFFGHVEVRGFATLAILISFFSGLILTMLGAIGEYLWRVLEAVNNKPEAVIDETFL
jgi:glycosyltransferase involved in cell wall biosynthesis